MSKYSLDQLNEEFDDELCAIGVMLQSIGIDLITRAIILGRARADPLSYVKLAKILPGSRSTLRKLHIKGCKFIGLWIADNLKRTSSIRVLRNISNRSMRNNYGEVGKWKKL